MVAIIQDDPYQCLIRKVGYSVGLEQLLKRVIYLTDLYVEQRGLSWAMFQDLVENKFARSSKEAPRDFADCYQQLHLLQHAWQTLNPLYTLETLSILRRYFSRDETTFISAAKIVLIQSILEADGDIFLNGLAAEFDAPKFKVLLESMINEKREALRNVIESLALLKKIYGIINIQSQPSNKGGSQSDSGHIQSRFEGRTEPFDSLQKRTAPLEEKLDDKVVISDDVLRKFPRTRKAWAKDFGLFERGVVTAKGRNLLNALDNDLRLKQHSGCYICWPYSSDLAKIWIKPEKIGAVSFMTWELLGAIAKGVSNVKVMAFSNTDDYTYVIDMLHDFYILYKEGNAGRGSIRLQLPLYIAQPCLVSIFGAKSQDIPPLPEILDAEIRRPVRRIEKVDIRETEGAITFPKGKGKGR